MRTAILRRRVLPALAASVLGVAAIAASHVMSVASDPSLTFEPAVAHLPTVGDSMTITVSAAGLTPQAADTVQINLVHDDSAVQITAPRCVGIYAGGYATDAVRVDDDRATAFSCSLVGGPSASSGAVVTFDITRVGPGEPTLEAGLEGPFATSFIHAGDPTVPAGVGTLKVTGGGEQVRTPGIPLGVLARAGDGEVTVTWRPPTDPGGSPIAAYTVATSPDGPAVTVPGTARSATVGGLANGKTYRFSVTAVNEAGPGQPTALSNAVTPAGDVPTVPLGLLARAGDRQVRLTWRPPANPGASPVIEYVISSSPDGPELVVPESNRDVTVVGLVNGVVYRFQVTAVNELGEGPATPLSNAVKPSGE